MSMVSLAGLRELIDSICRERNLPKPAVQAALQEALLKGYERYRRTQRITGPNFDEGHFDNFEVELDTEEEGFRILATKRIVEEVEDTDHEIALHEVQEVVAEAQLGDTVVLDVTPDQGEFGRMAAIQTKQVLAQKLRDQQRKLVQEEFQDLEETVLQARVLRFERQSVVMAVSSSYGQPEVEAELAKREQLPNDNYRANATFKVYLKKISEGSHRGPQLQVSRADAGLVVYLFENEVPEIQDEIVRIVAVAREANPPSRHVGPRTKIAVDTTERDVDPVGACIGARGSRIQAVVQELRGEKIDVIRWSPDPATYISNALSPARVDEVRLVDPEERQAHVLVADDQLSLAIGKEGQNVRLAARLTGWKIDIKDTAKYDYEAENRKIEAMLEARRVAMEARRAALEAAAAAAAARAAEEEALAELEEEEFLDELDESLDNPEMEAAIADDADQPSESTDTDAELEAEVDEEEAVEVETDVDDEQEDDTESAAADAEALAEAMDVQDDTDGTETGMDEDNTPDTTDATSDNTEDEPA